MHNMLLVADILNLMEYRLDIAETPGKHKNNVISVRFLSTYSMLIWAVLTKSTGLKELAIGFRIARKITHESFKNAVARSNRQINSY